MEAIKFKQLALASLGYALIYTFCCYDNPFGITNIIWVIGLLLYTGYLTSVFGKNQKPGSRFLSVSILLLGISSVITGNADIVFLNSFGIFVLVIVLLLHNFARDETWDVVQYVFEITASIFGAVGFIFKPFTDLDVYLKNSRGETKDHRGRYVVLGICIAIPCLIFLGGMLMAADMVFEHFVDEMFYHLVMPQHILGIIFTFLFGFFGAYCGVRFVQERTGRDRTVGLKRYEPVVAIVVSGMVGALYVAFCVIQVVYLFAGGLQLPAGITYAQYARSGFFQLLFICILNLVAVLGFKKFFSGSKILDGILVIVSVCTLVMTASSAYRMILYIGAYQLTFLRVLVLVSLFAIAVLMMGIIVWMVHPAFPLLRFGVAAITLVYLLFSYSHVDYLIAQYNLGSITDAAVNSDEERKLHGQDAREDGQMTDGEEMADYMYLAHLSTDAAPAIAGYVKAHPECRSERWYTEYVYENEEAMEDRSPRKLNVSHLAADFLLQ